MFGIIPLLIAIAFGSPKRPSPQPKLGSICFQVHDNTRINIRSYAQSVKPPFAKQPKPKRSLWDPTTSTESRVGPLCRNTTFERVPKANAPMGYNALHGPVCTLWDPLKIKIFKTRDPSQTTIVNRFAQGVATTHRICRRNIERA